MLKREKRIPIMMAIRVAAPNFIAVGCLDGGYRVRAQLQTS